jgi:hypothetical protein
MTTLPSEQLCIDTKKVSTLCTYNLAGFDLTTHSSSLLDDRGSHYMTTLPSEQLCIDAKLYFFHSLYI